MSDKIQTIQLGHGLDDLPFGASQAEVEEVLGKPDQTDMLDLKGEKSLAWHYWDLGISLNFDEEQDMHLSSIDVASPEVLLFGTKMIGKTRKEVKELLDAEDIGESEEEVQGGLIYPDVNLGLWFYGDELAEIQWGVISDS